MTQDNRGNSNRNAWRDYYEKVDQFFSRSEEIPLLSNLPKAPLYAYEFIGREKEIWEIRQIIFGWKWGYKLSIEWIWWLGKTTLAYEVCNKFLKEECIACALWFTAKLEDFSDHVEEFSGNFSDVKTFLKEAITLLGYDWPIHELTIEELKMAFRKAIARQTKKWKLIFVLDNLETVKDKDFFNLIKEMQHFAGDFFLIVTSRNNLFLYNENSINLHPFERGEMISIIENYKKLFRLWKLVLEQDVILNFCAWNPLIARILVQKMVYSTGEKIYHEYIKEWSEKWDEILNYIFKNTFDSLSKWAQLFLLILSKFEVIEDFILMQIEDCINKDTKIAFKIVHCLENELRKTFFVSYQLSDASIFQIENLHLEDFVWAFLRSCQTNDSISLYARVNTEILKQRQRISRYQKIAKDYWAKNDLEILIISKIIDRERSLAKWDFTPEKLIQELQDSWKKYEKIPYIPLSLSKTHRRYYPDKLSEAIAFGENALNKWRLYIKDSGILKHYILHLSSLYHHARLYSKSYDLNKELLSLGFASYRVYDQLIKHELNIGDVTAAYATWNDCFNLIEHDLDKYISGEEFRFWLFIQKYFQAAQAVWDFGRMKFLYELSKKAPVPDSTYDIDRFFKEDEKYCHIHGEYRFRIKQEMTQLRHRLQKWFIDEDTYAAFIKQELKKDPNNPMLLFASYRQTKNITHLFEAYNFDQNNFAILDSICHELIKWWKDGITRMIAFAERWIALYPDSISFYGYKWVCFSKNGQQDKAIEQIRIGMANYEKMSQAEKESTWNKKHYDELLRLLSLNLDS